MVVDYPGRPDVITTVLAKGRQVRGERKCCAAGFGEEGGDHEPRNVGSVERLEKIRKHILYWTLQKECSLHTGI